MFTQIYEQLQYDTSAIYQIKIKGTLTPTLMKAFASVRISIETADHSNPVTMLTGTVKNQAELLSVLNLIHANGYPIIAVSCIEVPQKSQEVSV